MDKKELQKKYEEQDSAGRELLLESWLSANLLTIMILKIISG